MNVSTFIYIYLSYDTRDDVLKENKMSITPDNLKKVGVIKKPQM